MEDFTVKTVDGNKVFFNVQGDEIDTYKETIEWMLTYKLEPLRDFLEILTDDDGVHREACIAQALLDKAEKEILEAVNFIQKNHGEIEVIRASHRQSFKPETLLDVKFTPAQKIIL